MRTILVLSLLASLTLAGCASDDSTTPTPTPTNNSSVTPTPTPTPDPNCINPTGPVCVTPPGVPAAPGQ